MRSDRIREEPSTFYRLVKPIVMGLTIGVLLCILLLLAFSLLIANQETPQASIGLFAVITAIASGFGGGFIAAARAGRRGALTGAVTGGILFLLLLLISFIAWHQAFGSSTLLRLILMPLSGALGGVLGVNIKKRR